VHGRKRGAGLDRHVHPAVFTELVPGIGQAFHGILDFWMVDDAFAGFHVRAPRYLMLIIPLLL
jgi:hypothetical protein